jgi:hypothetical protein
MVDLPDIFQTYGITIISEGFNIYNQSYMFRTFRNGKKTNRTYKQRQQNHMNEKLQKNMSKTLKT